MKPFSGRIASGGANGRKQRWLALACLWAAAWLSVQAIDRWQLVAPAELAVSDGWHRLAGARQPVRHVALVVIDDAALEAYKDDPLVFWTPYVAHAAQVLRQAGASVVGLDLMYSISPERWLDRHGPPGHASRFDNPLQQEIAAGELIMAASTSLADNDQSQLLLPAAEFVLAVPDLDLARHVGFVDLIADTDGAVRRFVLAPKLRLPPGTDAASLPRLSFAALLATRATGSRPTAQPGGEENLQLGGRSYRLDGTAHTIAYPGPPGHIPRVSFAALMAPDALSDPAVQALKGRVVIIGGEYAGMNDTHATPYVSGFIGGGGRYMTGPEVQGAIVETLLSGRMPQRLPLGVELAATAAFLLAATLSFQRLRPVYATAALLVLVGAASLAAYALFLSDILFPLAALIAGTALLFPMVLGWRFYTEERERGRVMQLFGRYVSDAVVDELVASGEPPRLGGARRTLTILFSDIRNFTVISEHLSAEEVVEMLNRYLETACRIILEQGGTIDKFIGDAVMVVFGAPVAHDDHADRALRTALLLRDAACDFARWMQERFPGRGLPDFAIGVGVHTGPAVIGTIGSERRSEYTAIGDTVNAASRIEGVTKEMHCAVLASAETLAACRRPVVTGQSRSVLVKGKSTPLVLHEILEVGTLEKGGPQ